MRRGAIGVALAAGAVALAGAAVVVILAPVPSPAVAELRLQVSRDEFATQAYESSAAVAAHAPADQPGCSAAVGRDGAVVWADAAGLADLSSGIPVTTSTRFDIASLSKQFTATAVLLLQRDGMLSLADPIAGYVDGLPSWGATVTLDQLMHHTSRIPDYWVELDDIGIGFTDAADQAATLDAIRRIAELDEGEGYEYSNSNYVLLAAAVERVSGEPFAAFLAQRIFEPLGLDMVLAPTLHAPDIALSYDDDLSLQEAGWTSYGHTGIITTPSQLAVWGDQYRTGGIVQDDFAAGAVVNDATTGERYGAGIYIAADGNLNHQGRMGGFITDFFVTPDRHTTIVVMCNGHLSDRNGLAAALRGIWG